MFRLEESSADVRVYFGEFLIGILRTPEAAETFMAAAQRRVNRLLGLSAGNIAAGVRVACRCLHGAERREANLSDARQLCRYQTVQGRSRGPSMNIAQQAAQIIDYLKANRTDWPLQASLLAKELEKHSDRHTFAAMMAGNIAVKERFNARKIR